MKSTNHERPHCCKVSKFPSSLLSYVCVCVCVWGGGSVVAIATGYGLDGPGIESRWGEIFRTCPDGPGPTQPSVQWVPLFPGVKSGRGVTLTPHTLLVQWSWKNRAVPLLPLWDVRPVQSLSACTKVHFTFTYLTLGMICHTLECVNHGYPTRRTQGCVKRPWSHVRELCIRYAIKQ